MVPNYRNLKLAQIEKFTLSGNDAYVRWGNDQWGVIKQKGHQLVKVEGADLTWFLLKK